MALERWQKEIYDRVSPAVTEIARELKKQHPEARFSLNHRLHYPSSFRPGEDAVIPITLLSGEHGLIHVANAIVSIDMNNRIVDIGLRAEAEAAPYDHSKQKEESVTFTNVLDRMSGFLNDINGVLFSDTMQALIMPKTDTISLGYGNTFSDNVLRTNGRRSLMPLGVHGTKIPITGNGRNPVAWSKVKTSRLAAEEARVEGIKTSEDQEKFIKESLASPAKAPAWYTALGGKQQEKMKEKILSIYMDMCNKENRTISTLLFFEKLTESMLQRGQVAPYCERDHDYIEGTASGKCLQQSCPIYSEDCSKMSNRLSVLK